MTLRKRTSAVCAGILVLLLIWHLWPAAPYGPSIRLPEGVSLAEALRDGKREPPKGWHTNIYCDANRPAPALDLRDRSRLIIARTRERIHEALGQPLWRIPNPAAVDYLTPRLGECFDTSGEKYLLAKEFVWEVDDPARDKKSEFRFLGFVYGGTNRVRHAKERIGLIEDGTVKNGIFGIRLKWPSPEMRGAPTIEYLPTNRCAIIRDTKGLVKIVPLDYLKAYAEAGLVTLPNKE